MQQKETIVFFLIESVGHVNPLISMMRELRRRGYKLIVLTIGPFVMAPKLRDLGFHVEVVNETIKDSEEMRNDFMKDLDKYRHGPMESFSKMCKNIQTVIFDTILKNFPLLKSKLEELKPALIIIDHLVVPTVQGVPWVRFVSLFPSYLYSKYNERVVAGLGLKFSEMSADKREFIENAYKVVTPIRDALALMGSPAWESNHFFIEPVSPYLNFYMGPQELGYESEPGVSALPDTFMRLEHTIEKPESKAPFELPDKLANLQGKLIYFSLGTIASASAELLNKLIGYLSKLPHRFIISMGQNHEQVKLYPNMWGAKYVDQKAILPEVDLFITHGGHNSTIEAFYYGVPRIIVMPVFADQYDSAQRIQDSGFGKRLDPFNCTEQELLEAIETLLADDKMVSCMRKIGLRMRSTRYYQLAADKLEALIRSQNKASE